MSKAQDLIKEDEQYFAKSGRIKYYPLAIDHGYGATLVDVDGKEYIDLLASASSQNVGHAPKKVTEAIKKQVDKFVHYTPAYMYHEPLIRLSKKLCDISPGDYEKRVTYGLSGSDANYGIIKFARAYTGRPYIISFTNAYHGSTFGSLSMSAISLNMRKKYGPLLNGFYHIPFPDNYRGLFEQPNANTVDEYLAPLKEMFDKYVPADEVACIVLETIQGDGGLLEPVPGYFEALEGICREHGILIAVDDIQQGLGRTGKWSSVEHFNFTPDLITFGKSLAGGLPMSAIVGRKEIMETLEAPAHLFTTGANPVSCEAALATLEMIEEEQLLEASLEKGKYVRQTMDRWVTDYECIGDVRGKGLSIGIDVVSDPIQKTRDPEAALKICNYCFDKGVVIIAVAGNVLRFQPPLVISYEQLDYALSTLEDAIRALNRGELDQYEIEGQGW
ncbi:aspartate aminotransferase family protein [Staphylococcus warneri]|uniref:aspartate aminotransferase family protein n=1 Tax=Staphylococcus warneri TaxID=1292 RepID=UPI0009D27D2E|nr:aspartate aminotransferase family protein [Staphylococcus warneri]MCC8989261.1 aspartate aminotransferase family protein [Staphylococcus sp.]SKR78465.1 Probable 4-aminobutyrate aminotransferase (GabT) [Mycobacteroides abscessus subsp. abscessus]MCM3069401.1 aspartate aminotransferase family protein [Staphylococcus warneri]MCT2595867.1 aspartate aminotransferase family protein [Staphylococcus warneri]PNZ00354.1 aspartate aminotransferase family protein [Staphylococcus warneri]